MTNRQDGVWDCHVSPLPRATLTLCDLVAPFDGPLSPELWPLVACGRKCRVMWHLPHTRDFFFLLGPCTFYPKLERQTPRSRVLALRCVSVPSHSPSLGLSWQKRPGPLECAKGSSRAQECVVCKQQVGCCLCKLDCLLTPAGPLPSCLQFP